MLLHYRGMRDLNGLELLRGLLLARGGGLPGALVLRYSAPRGFQLLRERGQLPLFGWAWG